MTRLEKSLIEHIQKFLKEFKVNISKKPLWISVSGGVDSVLLLHLFSLIEKEGKTIINGIIHFNHGNRIEQIEEEKFVKKLGEKYRKKVKTFHLKISKNQRNFENTARLKRYEVYENFKECWVLQGHHLDDSYEWHLMQKSKSSSLKSTLGIPFVRDQFLRPFMCLSKLQIKRASQKLKITYMEDTSNHNVSFERNYLRQIVIPNISKKYPQYLKHYVEQSNEMIELLSRVQKSEFKVKKWREKSGRTILEVGHDLSQQELDQVKKIILQKSLKDRGKTQEQLKKLKLGHKNGKYGPYSFSGGVRVFSSSPRICVESLKEQKFQKNLDKELAEELKRGAYSSGFFKELNIDDFSNMIFPYWLASNDTDILDKISPSLKIVDNLWPSLTQEFLKSRFWFRMITPQLIKLLSKNEEKIQKVRFLKF